MNSPAVDKTIRDQQEALTAFRKRFNAKTDEDALNKLDELIQAIKDMHADSVKYPQLYLNEYQEKQLERIRDLVKSHF